MKLREIPNAFVHCKTREEYDRLMQIYEEAGWKWNSGEKPNEHNVWADEKEDTVVEICNKFMYSSIRDSGAFPNNILSLQEFLDTQGLGLKDLKKGDWVEVVEDFIPDGCSETYFKTGDICQVASNHSGLILKMAHKPSEWFVTKHAHKLRKCSPPEEKKVEGEDYCTKSPALIEAEKRERAIRAMYGDNPWDWALGGHDRTVICGGKLAGKSTVQKIICDHYNITSSDRIDSVTANLASIFSPTPFMSSIVQKAKRAFLSKLERSYRDQGLKNEDGTLTQSGRELLCEQLFEKFGKELMDPVVKKLAKQENGEDDE